MKLRQFYLIVAAWTFGVCHAKSLLDYADQIPACGISCILQAIPASACQTVTNQTCICTDSALFNVINDCMAAKCTVYDRLAVAKIDEQACERPMRHATADIAPLLALDAITLICLLTRLIARYRWTGKMEMDDWVVLALLPFYLVFMTLGNYVRLTAIGYDIWDLEIDTIKNVLRVFFVDELFYTAVLSICRVNLLLLLIRVFSVPAFRKVCWICVAWVVVSAVIIILMTLFQCSPINYNWDGVFGDFGSHKCLDVNALAYAAAGMGIAQDLAILLLPLPIIFQLKMAPKKRLLTLFMFSLGIFILLASCLRLRYLTLFAKSLNPTWDNTNAVIWTSIEVKVSVIVLCLPTIRMIFALYLPSIFGGSEAEKSTKQVTPHTGSNSARMNYYYEDLSDGAASVEPPPQTWGHDIELRGAMDSNQGSARRSEPKETARTGTVTVAFAVPQPAHRTWLN